MTSTPAASSSSAIFGVMPRPPATFSALTTTNVGRWRSTSPGSSASSVRRPSPPTTSPTNRMLAGASGTPILWRNGAMSEHQQHDEDLLPDDPPPRARDDDFDDHDPLENEPPPPSAEPVVVPRWIQLVALPLLLLLGFAVIKARGPGRAALRHRGGHRADPQPARGRPAARATCRAAWRSSASTWASSPRWSRRGVLLANPIADQVTTLRDDIPSITDSANARLADVQDYFDDKGIDVEIKKQGQTALETLQEKVVGGTDGSSRSAPTCCTQARHRRLRADPRLRPVGLHAHLRRANRRARARGSCRPATARREDDYPTRVERAVAGYVRGQLLFSLAMGAGRRHRAVDLRRARDLPRRQDLRAGLRRVLRADGARPVRRAVPGRGAAAARRALPGPADRGVGGAAVPRRCSRSRATSSRRRSSATRCASTRCS